MLFFPTDPNLLAVDRAVGAKGAVLDEAELVHYLKKDHFTIFNQRLAGYGLYLFPTFEPPPHVCTT